MQLFSLLLYMLLAIFTNLKRRMRRKFWIDSIDLWSFPLFAEMGLFVCFRLALTTNQNSVFCCGTISLSFRSCSFICSSVTLSTSVVLNLFLGSDTFWKLAIHLSIQTIDKSQITRTKRLNRRFGHTRTVIPKVYSVDHWWSAIWAHSP